jgi:hypothetical protein
VEQKTGDRVQTVKRYGHFNQGEVTDVDPIGIDGVPHVYILFDNGIKQWRPVTDLTEVTDEVCYCHSCCYVFNRNQE